jgi:DNA polymerase-3 subunit gamma/tau
VAEPVPAAAASDARPTADARPATDAAAATDHRAVSAQPSSESARPGPVSVPPADAAAGDEPPSWLEEGGFAPEDAGFMPGDPGFVPDDPGFMTDDEGGFETLSADVGRAIGAAPGKGRSEQAGPSLQAMTAQGWPALAATLPLTGLAAELARQSEWLGADGSRIALRVAVRSLADSPGKSRLRTVLSEHFGSAVQLEVECGATGDATAHAVAQARLAALQREAEQAVEADPFVQSLVDEFGGMVIPGSVQAVPEDKAA